MIPLVSCQSDLNIRYVETISRIIVARSKRPTALASMALEAKSTGSDYYAADDKSARRRCRRRRDVDRLKPQ